MATEALPWERIWRAGSQQVWCNSCCGGHAKSIAAYGHAKTLVVVGRQLCWTQLQVLTVRQLTCMRMQGAGSGLAKRRGSLQL